MTLLSGSIGSLIGALIGAAAVWLVFMRTRENDRQRDEERTRYAERTAANQRRVDVAADLVERVRAHDRAYTEVPGDFFSGIHEMQSNVTDDVDRASVRLVLDDPQFSQELTVISMNLREATFEDFAAVKAFRLRVVTLSYVVTDWARDPVEVRSGNGFVELISPPSD